jgi:hypothetical protein
VCVCSVLSADLYFQVHQARRRYTRLLTGELVNQLILRLIKCPDYPQPPKRGTPATMQFTRMTLIRPSCSSHRLEVGDSDKSATGIEVFNRSAHCEGINGRQPHNLITFLLLAAPTMSAHERAGATGSILHKRVWCNSDIDQLEKHRTDPQKFATSVDLSATTIVSHGPSAK